MVHGTPADLYELDPDVARVPPDDFTVALDFSFEEQSESRRHIRHRASDRGRTPPSDMSHMTQRVGGSFAPNDTSAARRIGRRLNFSSCGRISIRGTRRREHTASSVTRGGFTQRSAAPAYVYFENAGVSCGVGVGPSHGSAGRVLAVGAKLRELGKTI